MELSPIIHQFVHVFWYLIPLAILLAVFKTAWFKGIVGELLVNVSAKMFLDSKEYRLLKNVTLPTENGSTQVDHVIVSIYGVFVIETKNMKGWIYGGQNQKIWTQKIYKKSRKFQNPLHQNYKHIKTLQSLLGLNDQQVHSLIVFVGDSTFKTAMPEDVTYGRGFIRYIKSKTQPVLNESDLSEILNKIESARLAPSFKTSREHVKNVKKIVGEKRTGRK
jgi:hypothetical protein